MEKVKQRKLMTTKEQLSGLHIHIETHLMNAEQRTATTSDEAITEMVHLRDAWRLNVFRTCERLTF